MIRLGKTLLPAATLAWLTLTSSTWGEDWPQWRGPRRDGTWRADHVISTFKTDQLTPKWRRPIGAGYSGPTVADGRVFVTDRIDTPEEVERIHCFDFDSGKPLWSRTYPCSYDAISYKAGPRAAVTIDGERAYAIGSTGKLHCLDVDNGGNRLVPRSEQGIRYRA